MARLSRLSAVLLSLFLSLAGGQAAVASGCPTPTSANELRLTLEEAEDRYTQLDVDGFGERMAAADAALRCLGEPISRPDAARLHRLRGLQAALLRDSDAATAAFSAARAVEPQALLSTILVPEGHPVQALYAAAAPSAAVTRLPEPADGYLLLDGIPDAQRPLERPVIFQHIAEEGAVLTSLYLLPEQPTPGYSLAPSRRAGRWLAGGAIGLGAAGAAGGYLWNRQAIAHYRSDTLDTIPALEAARGKVTTSGVVTLGGAALAVGGGLSLVWVL